MGGAALAPRKDLPGENSITLTLGGGEAHLRGRQFFAGLLLGRRCGDPKSLFDLR